MENCLTKQQLQELQLHWAPIAFSAHCMIFNRLQISSFQDVHFKLQKNVPFILTSAELTPWSFTNFHSHSLYRNLWPCHCQLQHYFGHPMFFCSLIFNHDRSPLLLLIPVSRDFGHSWSNPSVSKSNRLHVDIFQFSFIKMGVHSINSSKMICNILKF